MVQAQILQLLIFAVISFPISNYDILHHRILNSHLLKSAAILIPFTVVVELLQHGYLDIFRAMLCSTLFGIVILIASIMSGMSLGMGDIKLITLLSAVLALTTVAQYMDWLVWVIACSGISLLFHVVRCRTVKGRIPFAPSLMAGTLVYLATRI
ncbi:MAG: hypothetical protein NTY21_03175 [Actinobacteria bacterium]|nr:hypothetical protein [Actinomycetota bacterium]